MSLLTGEPRSSSVTAVTDCDLVDITVDALRQFVLTNPTVVDQIGAAVATRAAELERHRAAGAVDVVTEPTPNFLARVRRFLRLSMT